MMTKTTGVIAAGSLAIGLAFGAASTVVGRDDAASDMADHMRGMTSMMGAASMADMTSMMGAGAMADMTSMMGAGSMADMRSMMGAGSPMGPGASMSTGDHRSHHVPASAAPTR